MILTPTSVWRHRATRHVLAWLLLFGLLLAAVQLVPLSMRQPALARLLFSLSLLVPPIYAHLWLLTHWLERGRAGRYAAGLVAVVAAGAVLDAATASWRPALPNLPAAASDSYDWADFANAAASIVFALVLSAGLHYLRRGIVSRSSHGHRPLQPVATH